jgi:hypothetical protein
VVCQQSIDVLINQLIKYKIFTVLIPKYICGKNKIKIENNKQGIRTRKKIYIYIDIYNFSGQTSCILNMGLFFLMGSYSILK